MNRVLCTSNSMWEWRSLKNEQFFFLSFHNKRYNLRPHTSTEGSISISICLSIAQSFIHSFCSFIQTVHSWKTFIHKKKGFNERWSFLKKIHSYLICKVPLLGLVNNCQPCYLNLINKDVFTRYFGKDLLTHALTCTRHIHFHSLIGLLPLCN